MQDKFLLIVEDDFLNRRFLLKTLLKYWVNVFEAKNAIEAITILEEKSIDLVVLDINLGENQEDGISLARKIKEKFEVSFLFISAYENLNVIREAAKTEPLAYLTKPYKEIDVLATVELALSKIQRNSMPQSSFIIVKENEFQKKLLISSIDYIESEANYLLIYAENKVFKYRSTIKNILKILPSENFVQTHRGFIVNRQKIEMFNSKNFKIKDTYIPISKSFLENL